MKQAFVYYSLSGERFVYRGGQEKTKTLIAVQGIGGSAADKPTILTLYET